MEMLGLIIGVIGGLTGIASAFFSWKEWQKTNRKIAMLTDSGGASEVLPAWYTSRMMTDHWLFGLVTTGGQIVVINRIKSVSDNSEWMDVELATKDESSSAAIYGPVVHAVADDRRVASLQIRNIVAALDLASS
ncbi:MAG: hypothetical protein HOP13_08205 [Alphaproteobacteria bacterium]|nr:hypothetical protein [Alphaproteobacteria bacterium]